MKSGPKPKILTKAQRKLAKQLIDEDILTLKAIAAKMKLSYKPFAREMSKHLGDAAWGKITNRRRFQKGHIPWIKGRKIQISQRHRENLNFKKGHIRGMAARVWRPIGTIVIRKKPSPRGTRKGRRSYKYVRWIKVDNKSPRREHPKNWQIYARYVWEKAHGPVPPGLCVVHLDGDTLNDNLDNLYVMKIADYRIYLHKKFPKWHESVCKRMSVSHRGFRKVPRPKSIMVRECKACGFDINSGVSRCTKCGSHAIVEYRRAI